MKSKHEDILYEFEEKKEQVKQLKAQLDNEKQAVNRTEMIKVVSAVSDRAYKESNSLSKQLSKNGGDLNEFISAYVEKRK